MSRLLLMVLAACSSVSAAPAMYRDTNVCTPEGYTDVAIQRCVDQVSSDGHGGVVLLNGSYNLYDTVVIDTNHVELRGVGRGAVFINSEFSGVMFDFRHTGGCGIRDVFLYSFRDSVVGIKTYDTTDFAILDTRVLLQGNGGTGISLGSRDSTSVGRTYVQAAYPLVLGAPGLVLDHTWIRDSVFHATSAQNVVTVIAERIQELTLDGVALVGGAFGILWEDSGNDYGKSSLIRLLAVRYEQAVRGGCSVYINRSDYNHLAHLVIRDSTLAYEVDGLCLLGVRSAVFDSGTFDGAPGAKFSRSEGIAIRDSLVVER